MANQPILIANKIPSAPHMFRAEGIHAYDILNKLYDSIGLYRATPKSKLDAAKGDNPKLTNFKTLPIWDVGSIFEEGLIARLQALWPGKYEKPAAIEVDQIWGSADILELDIKDNPIIDIDPFTKEKLDEISDENIDLFYEQLDQSPANFAVNEVKCTWLYADKGPDSEQFWKYWTQLKAYCYKWGTNLGILHVLHINGYGNLDPIYRKYFWYFTDEELFVNWRLFTKIKDEILANG